MVRNELPRGLAFSRNRGVEEATTEYVIHLDDDDLLAVDAIEQCLTVFSEFPEVELVMFAVQGFGPNSEHFNRVQPDGVRRVITLAEGTEVRPNILLFEKSLFAALLHAVPSAFQRVMIKKPTWYRVSELRWRVYRLDPAVPDNAAAQLAIGGPLRDSEWARYAATLCKKTALINRALYLARCEGQGYSSHPANRELHMTQGLDIIRHLAEGAKTIPELTQWRPQIDGALAQANFDAAYRRHLAGDRKSAWTYLKQAMSSGMKIKHLRLALRIFISR